GRCITDAAAATVDSLDASGFLVSTLILASMCGTGTYTELYHFGAKEDIFPDFVNEKHPELVAKMSRIQTGYFMTSHQILPSSYLRKPNREQPHLDVNSDIGNFVYAVSQTPPGRAYMTGGTTCTWSEWISLWGRVESPLLISKWMPEDMISAVGDADLGLEAAYMFSYASDPGYDSGVDMLKASDLRKASETRRQ
ncbi:hypothetical protein GQ53DRAFT_612877, partial [Thozetella sp. PMI_491]